MAYEIPQQLAYKEKIMFGLTFKQLLYAFLFGSIILLIFRRAESLSLKIILSMFPSLLGLGFIFFNLEEKIKNYYIFFKFRELKSKDSKLRDFFGIKDIKDNFIVTSKNKRIAVLKVSTINFSIKSDKEKEAIIKSFQKFLNSLDFPIQILMNTESVELDDYLNSLKLRMANPKFGDLFEEYKNHLHHTIKTNKIMNRVFYVIIPEEIDIGIQINICMERLGGLNIKS